MFGQNFAIVDVETTGGSPFMARVLEVGVLRVENGKVTETYQQLINPGCEIPYWITRITGIRSEHVEDAPTFEEVAKDLRKLFHNAIFVAHNCEFDYAFIKSEFARSGIKFNSDRLCTVKLSRALFPKYRRHNLTEVIERFNFECENRHRAFDDAKVLWDFLQRIHQELPQEDVMRALNNLITKTRPRRTKVPTISLPIPT